MRNYAITVRTGTEFPELLDGPGTDSRISLAIFGSAGATPPLPLDAPNGFSGGQTSHFSVSGPDVGIIQTINVISDGGGSLPEWFPDRIEVDGIAFPIGIPIGPRHRLSVFVTPSGVGPGGILQRSARTGLRTTASVVSTAGAATIVMQSNSAAVRLASTGGPFTAQNLGDRWTNGALLRAQDGSVRTFLLARVDDPRGQTAVFQAPENGPLDLVSILPGQLVSDAGFAVAMNQVSTSGGQKEFPQLFVPVAPGGIVGIRQEIQHDASGRVLLPATSAFTVTDRLGTPGPAFSNLIVRLNRLDGLLEAFALAPDPANPTGPSFVWHNKQRLTDPSLEKVPNWTTAWTKFVDDPAVDIEAFDVAPGADNLLNVVAIGKRAGVMGVFHARRAFTGAPPIPAAAAGWNSLQPLAGVDPNGGIAALRIVGGVTPVQGRRLSVFVSTASQADPSRRIVFNAVQTAPDSATWDSWLALPPLEAPAGRLTLAVDPTAVVVNPTVFAVTAAGRLSRSVHVASGFQPWSAVF